METNFHLIVIIIVDILWFINLFKPNQQPGLAKHVAIFFLMLLDYLGGVHSQLKILFDGKTCGLVNEKFRRRSRGTIMICGCMMKIWTMQWKNL